MRKFLFWPKFTVWFLGLGVWLLAAIVAVIMVALLAVGIWLLVQAKEVIAVLTGAALQALYSYRPEIPR